MPGVAVVGPTYDVTLQAAVAGKNSCNSSGCDERWGDYLGTAIDPSDPTAVWVSGLYQVDNGGFGWGTWIAKVSTGSFALPTVTTGAASSITASGASVAGTVNPNGVATTYHVDYGLTSGYDSATTETSAGSGTSAVPVSAILTGLKGNTTYHYRVVATTATGSAIGKDLTFKTAKAPKPTITSVAFTGTGANPTVTITGTNFGSLPSATPAGCGATGSNYGATGLWFQDVTQGKWTAGKSGDCIGLVVSTWTSTQIVFGFGSFYSGFGPVTNKDKYKLEAAGVTKSGTVTYS
jgi:hypothetical protein